MYSAERSTVVKSPFNTQTYQRRLRHLQSIAVRSLSCPRDHDLDFSQLQVFFTLHTDEKTKAFYTSEKITGSLNPTWQSFDLHRFDSDVDLTSKSVLVRVWMCQGHKSCKVKIQCHVHLTGLVFFSKTLQVAGIKHPANTLLFGLHNHYFFHYDAATTTQNLNDLVPDKEVPTDSMPAVVSVDQSLLLPSYNINSLSRIHTVQRAIRQTSAAVTRIHSNIEDRLLASQENTEKLSQREMLLMKVRQLRQELLWQTQQKEGEEDHLARLKEEYEERFEKLKKAHAEMSSRNTKSEESRALHIQSREMLVKENAQVQYRRKQIVTEMAHCIYPIIEDEKQNFLIVKVKLPNAEDYQGQDETRVAVALGFTCHLTQMMSHFMDMPLRYPMVHRGSRSIIIDHVHSKLTDKDREFPLYSKGKEKFQFNYAVFLLNKNISQLRFYCGMGTQDLRQTLPNLKSFLEQRLGVRAISGSQRGTATPRSVSVAGSMSTSSSQARIKDGSAEYDPVSRSTSMRGDLTSVTGDGISLTDMDSVNFPHSQNTAPHSTSSHSASNGTALPHAHIPTNNTNYNHSSQQSSQQKGKQKQKNNVVVASDDEKEDIFKPSNDNFFAVKVPPSSFATSMANAPLSPELENSLDASTDTIVIPTSENLSNNDQRTFKLLRRSPAIPVSSSEEKSTDKYMSGATAFSNGAHNSIDSVSHVNNGRDSSGDLQASYNQSYSSIDSAESYVTSNEHKPDIPVSILES